MTTVHPQMVDEEVVNLLKESGCREVDMGVQSVMDSTRRNILRRPGDNEGIRRAVKLLKGAGIYVYIDHIGGIPFEGKKDQIEAVRFYNEIRPYWVSFYWLSYYPHSDIINTAIEAKLLSLQDVENIEEGFSALPARDKKFKDVTPFEILIQLTPLLPRQAVNFILNRRIYRVFRWTPLFIGQALPRLIASLVRLDNLLIKSFFRRYMNLFKFISKDLK